MNADVHFSFPWVCVCTCTLCFRTAPSENSPLDEQLALQNDTLKKVDGADGLVVVADGIMEGPDGY